MTVVERETDGPGTPDAADFGAPEGAVDGSSVPTSATGVRGWRSLTAGAGAYLVLSVAMWWNVWSGHPTSTTTCGCGDSSLFTWFLEWPAYAISHGLSPLHSDYLFHPSGINLLSNTAEVGLGIFLAPVTWLFGPIATLNVALTLSPFLSALTMYVLLRRWVSWAPAAFVGGLLYGFSPFLVISLTDAHLMLGFAAVPPLLVLCLDELFVRQRWSPWALGLAFGGLALVQMSVGTEVLVLTIMCAGFGSLLVLAWGLTHREVWTARAPYAIRGGAAALVSSAVLLAYPAWYALAGPTHLSGAIWGSGMAISYGGNALNLFLHPMSPSASATALTHRFGGYQAPTLSDQYLGWGLVSVLAVGLVIWWRDLRLWLFAAVGMLAIFLSLGLKLHGWTLWHLVVHAPLMGNVIPSRFGIVIYLCVAVMLGVVCDHVHRAVVPPGGNVSPGRSALGAVATLAVAALALVPIFSYFADGLPLTVTPVHPPLWFRTVAPHLPPHQVLLVFPFAFRQSNMTWQAVDEMHYAMVGGGGPDSIPSRAGKERAGEVDLADISLVGGPQVIVPAEVAAIRSAIDGWGVTGVVLPNPNHLPEYEQVFAVRAIVTLVTAATGQVPTYTAGAWVWMPVDRARPPTPVSLAGLARCSAGSASGPVRSIDASAACILGSPSQA